MRSYSEDEWRGYFDGAGLRIEPGRAFAKTHDLEDWLARTGCAGAEAEQVRELLAEVSEDGDDWHDAKIIVKARKAD